MRRMSEGMGGMSEAFPESYKEWIREEKGRVEELFPGIFRERKKALDMLSKNVWKAVYGRSYLEVGKEEIEYLTRMPPRVLITSIYKTTFDELRPLVRELGEEYAEETDISEEKVFKELRHLMRKLERGEVLNADEVASLMRIEEFARSKGREELLREVERAFTKLGELTKNIAAEPEKMELKKGEIREIDENTLIRRRKDGKLELILL